MSEQTQAPDTMGLAQAAVADKLYAYRSVLGGTDAMRAAGETFLPRFEAEDPSDYAKRLNSAVLYNATELALDALVGMVLRTDPELSDALPKVIRDHAENIDLSGRHLSVFAKDLFRDAWDGLACIFVDMQRADPEAIRTRAAEKAAGLRPYWIEVRADQIRRARPLSINGKVVAGSFAYRESVTVEDGEFGEKVENRVRDYRREITGDGEVVTYRVFAQGRDAKDPEAWMEVESGVMGIGEIPVVPCYTNPRAAFFAAEPTLLDLARENIDHYQQRSEHRVAWKYARIPMLVFPGMQPEQVVIAANRGICTPNPDAKPYYMETAGTALEGSKLELLESERRMANLSVQALYRPERTNETATARRMENAQSTSRLSSAARALEDALEEALRLHALWAGVALPTQTDGRWITINKDFEQYELDAQGIAALDAAVGNGHLRLETFLTALRDGVPVLAMLDPEAEAELLASEIPPPPAIPAAQDVPPDAGAGAAQDSREARLAEAERKVDALIQKLDPELAQQLKEAA